jgi:hypothetical protein
MRIKALVTGRAIAVLSKPPTFWHTPQIVFMKEFTSVALFAQATKPVLTNGSQTFTLARMCG